MKGLFSFLFTSFFALFYTYGQLPTQKFGQDNTLEIATWNIQWFGDEGKGPDDEELQLSKLVDNGIYLNFDIIGLQEIVDQEHFISFVSQLSGYQGVRSKETAKSQQVAIVWNPNSVTLLNDNQILVSDKHFFAQRPPHLFEFQDKTGAIGSKFYVIVLHLKAHLPYVSDDKQKDSYERRKKSSQLLAKYIDTELPDEKVIVLGDWNDDIDVSNYKGLETPFQSLIASPNYDFTTAHLSWAGASSTKYGNVIDHILISNELFDEQYQTGVASLTTFDKDYIKDLSDHLPVYIIFR